MTKWQYGYLSTFPVFREAGAAPGARSSKTVVVVRLSGGVNAQVIESELSYMDALGSQGWQIAEGQLSTATIPSTMLLRIEALGVEVKGGYWVHFMRREIA